MVFLLILKSPFLLSSRHLSPQFPVIFPLIFPRSYYLFFSRLSSDLLVIFPLIFPSFLHQSSHGISFKKDGWSVRYFQDGKNNETCKESLYFRFHRKWLSWLWPIKILLVRPLHGQSVERRRSAYVATKECIRRRKKIFLKSFFHFRFGALYVPGCKRLARPSPI